MKNDQFQQTTVTFYERKRQILRMMSLTTNISNFNTKQNTNIQLWNINTKY